MRSVMKFIKYLCYRLVLLFILCSSLAIFLFTTTPGLYLSVKLANLVFPGHLTISKASGRLADHFIIEKLIYSDGHVTLTWQDIQAHWSLHDLLHQHQLVIKQLHAASMAIKINPRNKPTNLPQISFPVIIHQAHLDRINYEGSTLHQIVLSGFLSAQQWQIKQLDGEYQQQQFHLKAQLQPVLPYALTGQLTTQPNPHSPSRLKGRLEFGGNLALYHWQGQLSQPAQLLVEGSLKNGSDLQASAAWQQLQWPLDQAYLVSQQGQAHCEGHLDDWTATINSQLQTPGSLALPFEAIIHYHQTLDAQVKFAAGRFDIQRLADQSWQFKGTIPQPAEFYPVLRGLTTSLKFNGQWRDDQGKLTMQLTKGHYQATEVNTLAFEGGNIHINLDQKRLQAHGQFTIDHNKNASVDFSLLHPQMAQLLNQRQAFTGQVKININSLDFLKELNPAIENAGGQLQMILKAQGQLNKPQVIGNLSLAKGQLILPAGVNLDPIDLKLTSKNQQWTVNGHIVSHNNALDLQGQGKFFPAVLGTVQLQGHDFPLINTEEYQIAISPKLALDFNPSAWKLTGDLVIPSAKLKPRMFTSSVNLSDDVVYTGNKAANSNPLHLETHIRLAMGQQVEISNQSLHGFLDGAINLHQRPNEPLRADGELTIREGKFNAYGQDLTISQGQLLFNGDVVENPLIKLRAVRQFNNASASFAGSNRLFDFNAANVQNLDFGGQTTVGIQMSGRLNAPKIQLFSIPGNLSQADILSMLLLGKPANQASQAGGQLLLTAISSMNLDSGSNGLQLLDQLKKSLGFDMNVENSTQYNQKTNQTTESTDFVIGKSLSNRLYLSYNFGLSQTGGNLLTLRYLLNRFFSVQVSASPVASGVDLLYTRN